MDELVEVQKALIAFITRAAGGRVSSEVAVMPETVRALIELSQLIDLQKQRGRV